LSKSNENHQVLQSWLRRVDNLLGKMMAKILKSLFFNKEQIERLKKLSAKTRVPISVYIREGVELVLNKYEKHLRNRL